MKIVLVVVLTAGILGSCGVKVEDSKNEINLDETFDGYLFYPKQGEIYLSNIEDLIGEYVCIKKVQDSVFTIVIGRAIKEEGKNHISKFDLSKESPPYSSRITGEFASDLSFGVGNLNLKANYVYDLVLKKNNSANVPREFGYIDAAQFGNIYDRIPPTFLGVYFITGIEYRTLSYKEYIEASGSTNIGLTAVKVNGKVFYSNEKINSIPIIYYTGIDESVRFGNFDANSNFYTKKSTSPAVLPALQKQSHNIVPEGLTLDKIKNFKNLELIIKAKPKI